MKKYILPLVILFIWIGCDILPDNRYDQPIPVLTSAEMRASDHLHIHLTFSHEMASTIPPDTAGFSLISGTITNRNFSVIKTGPSNYALVMTNLLYSTNTFTLEYEATTNRVTTVAGGVLASFSNVSVLNSLVEIPVLWNTLGSANEIGNSSLGPDLVLRNGTHSYGLGYFDYGFNSPEGSLYGNGVYIPENTVPKTDVTVEFWYVRNGSFVSNVHMKLIGGRDLSSSWKNLFSLSLCPDMDFNSVNYGSVIQARMRIHSSAFYEVRAHYSYGNITNLEAAFPLGTPVHVAVTKRNTDGALGIYVDGQPLGLTYLDNGTEVTANSNYLAGESGTFPFNLAIGNNYESSLPSEPARGVIDNIKVYSIVKTNYADRFTEGYIY